MTFCLNAAVFGRCSIVAISSCKPPLVGITAIANYLIVPLALSAAVPLTKILILLKQKRKMITKA